jgi:hypothetical protein
MDIDKSLRRPSATKLIPGSAVCIHLDESLTSLNDLWSILPVQWSSPSSFQITHYLPFRKDIEIPENSHTVSI